MRFSYTETLDRQRCRWGSTAQTRNPDFCILWLKTLGLNERGKGQTLAPPTPPFLRRPPPSSSAERHIAPRNRAPTSLPSLYALPSLAGPKPSCSARLCCATCWPGVCSRVLRRASSACPTDLTRPCSIFRVRIHSVSYTAHPPRLSAPALYPVPQLRPCCTTTWAALPVPTALQPVMAARHNRRSSATSAAIQNAIR